MLSQIGDQALFRLIPADFGPVRALAGQRLPDDLGQGREYGVLQLGRDESDEPGAAAAQLHGTLVAEDVERGEDGLAWMVLRNPARLNAVRYEMWEAIPHLIAALAAEGPSTIDGAEAVDISYPGFFSTLDRLVV